MMITNSSPPKPACQIDAPRVAPHAGRELFQHGIAAGMAVGVVDGLEEVDVGNEDREWPAALQGFLQQRARVAFHIAAVIEAGQWIGDRGFDALLDASCADDRNAACA